MAQNNLCQHKTSTLHLGNERMLEKRFQLAKWIPRPKVKQGQIR